MKLPKNKSATLLLGTVLALSTVTLLAASKITPFLTHTFTYCESVVKSVAWQMPGWGTTALLVIVAVLAVVSVAKLVVVGMFAVQLHFRKIAPGTLGKPLFTPQQEKIISSLGLSASISVIDDPRPSAFCFGLLKPHIYISSSLLTLLSAHELETILRHEKYHMEQNDSAIMFLIYSVQHLFPFFPLLSDLIKNYRIEREIRADEAAIQGRGESQSLVSVLRKLLVCQPPVYPFTPALADIDTLDARIKALVHGKYRFNTFNPIHIILSAISVGIITSIFFIPVQASEAKVTQEAMMVCFYSNEKVVTPHLNRSVPFSPASQ